MYVVGLAAQSLNECLLHVGNWVPERRERAAVRGMPMLSCTVPAFAQAKWKEKNYELALERYTLGVDMLQNLRARGRENEELLAGVW